MKYLIKDLARMTGLSPARIRKWQERYDILRPGIGSNGYYYYGNDDLRILKILASSVKSGQSISSALAPGREKLLASSALFDWQGLRWKELEIISEGRYDQLKELARFKGTGSQLRKHINEIVRPLLIQVGQAWEDGVLSVADEHSFTRWLAGQVQAMTQFQPLDGTPLALVAVFPGETHELPAFLFAAKLSTFQIPLRFVGELPEDEIKKELSANPHYERLYMSATMPRPLEEFKNFEKRINAALPDLKIVFGGQGYRQAGRKSKKK